MTPRAPIEAPSFSMKSADHIGEHFTQVAIDRDFEYAIFSNSHPRMVAAKLRDIADHIEEWRAHVSTNDAV